MVAEIRIRAERRAGQHRPGGRRRAHVGQRHSRSAWSY
jgi:hypothetical protein